MNPLILALALAIISPLSFGQETFKCKVNGSMVYQDRPCPGTGRYSESLPPTKQAPPVAQATVQPPQAATQTTPDAAPQKSKLEQDKEYIDQRVKARIYDREKSEAAINIQNCESEAANIQWQIESIANPAGGYPGVPLNMQAAQLEEQRKQTQIAGLQSRVTAKRGQCDALRRDYEFRFKK